MRAHIIEGGKVVNTIEVESLDFLPNLIDAALGGKIGDLWDGNAFSAPPQDDSLRRAEILAQIDKLERDSMLNRGSRELELRLMEKEAAELAASMSTPENVVTMEQVLAEVPYYAKVKALDDQIAELRGQL